MAVQRLARHTTIQLTLGRYTHANLFDLKSAVDMLLPLSSPSTSEREATSNREAMTSLPIRNSHDFPEELSEIPAKTNPISGDSRGESIGSDTHPKK